MKNNKIILLIGLMAIIGTFININSSSAFIKEEACKMVFCETDCRTGNICQITMYKKDGTLCSTTTCNGYGPRWD